MLPLAARSLKQTRLLYQHVVKTHMSTSVTDTPHLKDHRHFGYAQKLFMFHPSSPGSPIFLPNGTRVFNTLLQLMKSQCYKHNFNEVISPLLYKRQLWEQSGHFSHFNSNMYKVTSAKSDASSLHDPDDLFYLKPMHCPGHCLIYDSVPRSYNQLPVRLAEFSPLHRNELSGALTGLTRVRRFHQDDAHIFCTMPQMRTEINSTLQMIDRIYRLFGFHSWSYELSTRPEQYLGSLEKWDFAESSLRTALNDHLSHSTWSENPGDGAFYGPKIDVYVSDMNHKKHQTATIQLDFQLPEKFNLQFTNADNSIDRPVLIHRAILGSVERMLAILSDHYQGKWPFWLSPNQIMIIPIHQNRAELGQYVARIQALLQGTGDPLPRPSVQSGWHTAVDHLLRSPRHYAQPLYVQANLSNDTLQDKIRSAIVEGFNYIVLVGDRELATSTVNLRPAHSTAVADDERAFAKFDMFPKHGSPRSRGLDLHQMVDFFHLIQSEFVANRLNSNANQTL